MIDDGPRDHDTILPDLTLPEDRRLFRLWTERAGLRRALEEYASPRNWRRAHDGWIYRVVAWVVAHLPRSWARIETGWVYIDDDEPWARAADALDKERDANEPG